MKNGTPKVFTVPMNMVLRILTDLKAITIWNFPITAKIIPSQNLMVVMIVLIKLHLIKIEQNR